jgi:hypothetical protein
MKTKTSDRHKRLNRKYQAAGICFGVAGLGLIILSSIDYLLTFMGIGLIAVGIYYFVDTTSFGVD